MEIKLTSHDIKIIKLANKNYSFRLNKNIVVEGIPTKRKAYDHAQELLKIIFKTTMKIKENEFI